MGSLTAMNTTGMLAVACFNASVAGVPRADRYRAEHGPELLCRGPDLRGAAAGPAVVDPQVALRRSSRVLPAPGEGRGARPPDGVLGGERHQRADPGDWSAGWARAASGHALASPAINSRRRINDPQKCRAYCNSSTTNISRIRHARHAGREPTASRCRRPPPPPHSTWMRMPLAPFNSRLR